MSSGSDFPAPQELPAQEQALQNPQPGQQAYGVPQAQPQPQFQPQQQFQQPQFQQPPQQMIVPKNPALGVILSFFIPGLGSMVNGDVSRGVIILVIYVVGWILSFFLIGIPIAVGAWIWGMVDGYLSAQRWNQTHGIVS